MNISDAAIRFLGDSIPISCGDTYESLVMLDGTPKPTLQELETAWQQVLLAREARASSDASLKAKLQQAEALLVKLDDGTATQAEVRKGLSAAIRVLVRYVLKTT